MSVFDEVFKLQEIFLAQEISQQLSLRDIHDPQIAERIIQICKKSNDQEHFMSQVSELNINISENFVNSLYDTIRQKLPRKMDLTHSVPAPVSTGNQEHHAMSKLQEDKHWESQNRLHNFPGLAIPDGDQINLDLDLLQATDKPKVNQQPVKKQELSVKKKEESYRSRSRERDRYRDRDQRRSDSRDRKHSKKDRKKEKRKRSYSDSEERDRKKKHRDRSKSQEKHRKYDDVHERDRDRDRYRDGNRDRDRQRDVDRQQKKNNRPQIKPLQVGKIYKGKVTKVNKMGCFVHMFNVINSKPAIVHSSHVRQEPTEDITKIVKEGLFIWVKVLEILQDRVRLSMKQVNQYNGKQFNKKEEKKEAEFVFQKEAVIGNIGRLTGIKIEHEQDVDQQGGGGTNNYNDQWEVSRLTYMGVISKKARNNVNEEIEDINIQVNDREPPFLTGQTTKTGINLSPVRVIKNPEGTLNREAMNALQYAKERRQIREQQHKNEVRDLNKLLDEVTPQGKTEPRKYFKTSNMSLRQQKESLPIFQYKKELVQACIDNNMLIIIGETGSGKTTQITQYLYQAGFHKRGKIGCTQPRRVAAMSVAKRVCEEMNVKLGDQVGYSIRFQDHTSSKTIIKYMTDGMLLRQALVDKYLSQYSVIMLDQAHERTINTDVLFGILKKVAQKRKDFLLIVTSATLQARKFSSYFFDCKIFSIPGRTYNVEILYAKQPETDYLDASLMCVMQIHVDEPPGDILLFLTGQEEIDTACQILNERLRRFGNEIPELIILPVYSALPSQLQSRIFERAPPGKRKCVIATNIAEASLTIDGIFYVVDPGFAKIKIYNSKLGMDTLVVAPISQASAKQRAGRAGRTGPGKCYRIYTEQAYKNEMLPTSVPEIQRANLANTVLELKAMGINDLINFDFMDAPPVQTLIVALQQLYYLSALDDEGLLTKLGRKMAEFPLEPPLSKMLLTSVDFGCTEEVITIIAMLSVQNIFYRPKEKEAIADQKKTKFNHFQGDHLTYLQVFQAWRNQGYSATWSKENFIQQRSLRRAEDVRKQLLELLQRYRFPIKSCGKNYSLIRKTIVSGFFFHAARKDAKGGYRTLIDDHQVYIHPSSALFNKQPEWVIYHELVFTTKEYMREVCTINPKWLIDVAPNFFKFTDQLGFTRKKRNEKLDPLDQRYGDPNAWRLTKRKG